MVVRPKSLREWSVDLACRELPDLRTAIVDVFNHDGEMWPWLRALTVHLARATGGKAILVTTGAEPVGPDGSEAPGHSTWVGGRLLVATPDGGSTLEHVSDAEHPIHDDCPNEEFFELFGDTWARVLDRTELEAEVFQGAATTSWFPSTLHDDPAVDQLLRRALLADVAVADDSTGAPALRLVHGESFEWAFASEDVVREVAAALASRP